MWYRRCHGEFTGILYVQGGRGGSDRSHRHASHARSRSIRHGARRGLPRTVAESRTGRSPYAGDSLHIRGRVAPSDGLVVQTVIAPLELLRGADEVGYIAEDGRSRAQAANEVRRRRKTGELPPVFPNGWYRVLDSHMLERGDVKSVTVLGK